MKKLDISQVDALFSNGSYPIEFLFFYRDAFDTDRMRRALRGLSSAFWPLFGEYRDGTILFDRYREEDFFDEEAIDREFDIPEMEENGGEKLSRDPGKGRKLRPQVCLLIPAAGTKSQ